ncbi:LD-carboxypeptidase [Carnobacterium maltaromaticum]|uniref:S66 family peptidase n=1 Tax=Carnobacterium TaxID=2747 RepID=UPI0028E7282C|nr:LD-carboxypeptidase [Carnobacterium maltaromaticum]MDW5522674.1 LD-carboxypeptidase [Carnobacterium maltaromaticum]
MLKKGDTIGIIACSNGKKLSQKKKINELINLLETQFSLTVIEAATIYEKNEFPFSGTPAERAQALMQLYLNPSVVMIFDISGGNVANEILPYLDFKQIEKQRKLFVGYSDLTVILNALYTKTTCSGINYQLLNLVGEEQSSQLAYFNDYFFHNKRQTSITAQWLSSSSPITNIIKGTLIGGNIRCLLKLAGTDYLPNCQNKLLFLEANSGDITAMATYLAQLDQIGYLQQCQAVILGQFTEIEAQKQTTAFYKLVSSYLMNYQKPILMTHEIGHSASSKALSIGEIVYFDEDHGKLRMTLADDK